MQKNICGTLLVAFLIGAPAYGRDFQECVVSTGQNEGFMYNDGSQDRCCLTDGTICPDIDTFYCAGYFNMPSSVWSGDTNISSTAVNGSGCFVNVPAGKHISDTYDLFDESRTYSDIIINCYSPGYYCPGMTVTYSDIKKNWGSTMVATVACPNAPSVFINKSLTQYASVESGHILSSDDASAITDCYLKPGTYYDNTGTYEILDGCNYRQ